MHGQAIVVAFGGGRLNDGADLQGVSGYLPLIVVEST